VAETLAFAALGDPEEPTSREALLEAGLESFAEHGYAGSRLLDITARAGLSTRAFYRDFASKGELFAVLFRFYADELQEALATATDLERQAQVWLDISRAYQGVIRAGLELVHRGTPEAVQQQRLRDRCAGIIASTLLGEDVPWRRARAAALVVVDMLEQYVIMEALGWVETRSADEVAQSVASLVHDGIAA
jgi:AcrR family transcriptional regulator